MKLLNRTFIFPILIHKTTDHYGDKADITIRFRKSKMAGSMKSTSFTLQIIMNGKEFQRTFVWRPDVTRYWWKKGDLYGNNN
jgi:hypothetical protein